jgi:phosphoglycolate phosphatase-like HAD superfamily hydrolase
MFRIIVFDFDGTLVDSNKLKREAFLRFARRDPGGEARMLRLLDETDGDRHAILAAYIGERNGSVACDVAVHDAVATYSAAVDAAVAAAPERPGASNLLERLRRAGLRLVLSSATPRENLVGILARRGWVNRFDVIADNPSRKADTLRELLSSSGVKATGLAVVGDGHDDRASAEAVGCPFYSVGEARGAQVGERVYALAELGDVFAPLTPHYLS